MQVLLVCLIAFCIGPQECYGDPVFVPSVRSFYTAVEQPKPSETRVSKSVSVDNFPENENGQFRRPENRHVILVDYGMFPNHRMGFFARSEDRAGCEESSWRRRERHIQRIRSKPTANPHARIIGRGFSGILNQNLNQRRALLEKCNASRGDTDVGPQLPYSRVSHGGYDSLSLFARRLHLFGGAGHLSSLPRDKPTSYSSDDYQCEVGEVLRQKQFVEVAWRLIGMTILLPMGCLLIYYDDRPTSRIVRLGCSVSGVLSMGVALGLGFFPIYNQDCESQNQDGDSHGATIVLQKYLTQLYSCSTVIDMANVLSTDQRIAVIGALAEGSSIRSIERMTGIHRDTIMRLGVKVGQGCTALLDAKMRDLPCRYLQFDEIWGFIGKKQRNLLVDDDETLYGDVWTFCAIDAETKLVPTFRCGKRDAVTANAFVEDVASRMRTRVQVTTDALRLYVEAIERGFGADVDYSRVIKTYAHDDSIHPERRYSAPEIVTTEKESVNGNPDMELASTSHIERLNGTTRLHMRRLTRLTYAFSKKLENFKAAAALHFAYYNLVKRHGTLRCTPAMAAGVEQTFWSVGDLVEAAS
jgi:IS1 family transposase